MKTALLFFASLFAFVASAQHYCGFDEFHESLCSDPAHRQKEQEMNHRIHERTLQGTSSLRMNEFTIPVVVHIIHQNGDENISDEQVQTAIEQLNDAFTNEGYYITPGGVDVGIRFCLAGTDPNGEFTTGIVRTESPLTNMLVPSQDQALKDVSRWDPFQYLNIWVVNEITREPNQPGVIGFATFPDSHGMTNDGIVCEAAYFGASEENSKVHIHELGHYLGLYHTFQNGCPNDDCLTSGDQVCDTPPDNVTFTLLCFDGTNSCSTDEDDLSPNNPFRPVALGGIGDQVDEEDNFMDYSNLVCFKQFTQGQADRMLAALIEARASLLVGDRCTTPCSEPFTVQVLSSGDTMNAGEELLYLASLPSGVSATWFVNEEQVGTGSSFTFTENLQGAYEITGVFESSDPGCKQEFIFNVTVVCPADAFFTLPSDVLPPDASVSLFGQEGPYTHTWQLNGTTFSTNSETQVTFAESGINVITHIITNGICTDTYSLNVAVGNCISGGEANIQYWNNLSGNAFGFDFSGNAPLNVVAEQPPFTGNSNHNRTTICDAAGNLRYVTDGNNVRNANFEIIPNSNFIFDLSCYMGTLFIEVPESEHLTYLFSNAASEAISNEGLRYSILDNTLNNGLGGMTEVKDVLIEPIGSEPFVSVSHCNLVDFWLLYYDFDEEEFHAHLVNADGIAPPVVSEVNLSQNNLIESSILSLSERGDKFILRSNVLHFDQATGEVELINNDFYDEMVLAYCFSPSGRYLYFVGGDLNVSLYRIDTQLPADTWQDNLEVIDELDFAYFGVGMIRRQDGSIYYESINSGYISRIEHPDAALEDIGWELNYVYHGTLINTFPNQHHAYVSGAQLYPEGPTEICIGMSANYDVFSSGCVETDVVWELLGEGTIESIGDGQISFTPQTPGNMSLAVSVELACGQIFDTLHVHVHPALSLDLGPDVSLCAGQSLFLDAGPDFDSYTWQDGSTDQTLSATQPGTYSVTVEKNGCQATDEVVIGSVFTPEIDLGEDIYLCDGELVVINAGDDFTDFVWHDGSTGQFFTAFEAGLVYVTATYPCTASDTLLVTDCGQVIDNVNELNAFGDALYPNPAFAEINLHLGSPVEAIHVYNAQGQRVWESGFHPAGWMTIALDAFSAGVYTIALTGNDQRVLKFVKRN